MYRIICMNSRHRARLLMILMWKLDVAPNCWYLYMLRIYIYIISKESRRHFRSVRNLLRASVFLPFWRKKNLSQMYEHEQRNVVRTRKKSTYSQRDFHFQHGKSRNISMRAQTFVCMFVSVYMYVYILNVCVCVCCVWRLRVCEFRRRRLTVIPILLANLYIIYAYVFAQVTVKFEHLEFWVKMHHFTVYWQCNPKFKAYTRLIRCCIVFI